ncbi:GNAT family N-acetyltransferase [Paenibacillus piscarius]|uniref:GNAT family N-acetyltransferase n=1 Tax=Paenibacillus piscarius TaxID=1089681 RepID=UPI001EE927AE|nr:GNAT family N-acetyltransferase [Paenibacillus piscarius]
MNGLIELRPEEYPAVYDFYNVKKQHIPALSVLLGNYPGRVFADHTEAPTLAIVWATGRWMYAAGDISSEMNRVKLESFLQTVVVPDCRHRQEKGFEIYTDDHEGSTALFTRGLAELTVDRHLESVYEFNRERFYQRNDRVAADSLPAEVTVVYEEFPLLGSEVHGASARNDRFIGRTATGAVLKVRDQVISICKNNGFIVENRYFIDVDTHAESERGKGYATLAAASLINHYLARGMIPLWETTHQNIASHKLALRLGFEPVESYPVFAFVMEENSTC